MAEHILERRQVIPLALREVFSFFESPGNLARITPPWLRFVLRSKAPVAMRPGAVIAYRIRWIGLPLHWQTLISAYDPPHLFVDEQTSGPYRYWHHTHRFREVEGGVEMTDTVRYSLPFGILGRFAHWLIVRRQLQAIFDYRERAIGRLIAEGAFVSALVPRSFTTTEHPS